MTEAIPQMIPNMVRKLRILWARNVANVCFKMSSKFINLPRQLRGWAQNTLSLHDLHTRKVGHKFRVDEGRNRDGPAPSWPPGCRENVRFGRGGAKFAPR